jgi:hypothetical protein
MVVAPNNHGGLNLVILTAIFLVPAYFSWLLGMLFSVKFGNKLEVLKCTKNTI